MAKGFDKNQEYLKQLSQLGKELTRRSRASCELCTDSGVSLSIYEVPPAPKEPELEKVLHLCNTCTSQLQKPKTINADHWRILSETVWSELPAAQVLSVRILKHLSSAHSWAQEILEGVYLEEDLEEWASQDKIQ